MSFSVYANYYLRNCYGSYRTYVSTSKRKEADTGTLNFADSSALKSSIRKLKDFDYEKGNKQDMYNALRGFVDTYNNTLSSASKSSVKYVKSASGSMKSLTSANASELKKYGITLDSSGYMTLSGSATTNIAVDKFEDLFGSDSEYMSDLTKYARKIRSHVDVSV